MIATIIAIWIIIIIGIPIVKMRCLVLCLKVYIPKMEPKLPPIIAIKKRVASGMRQLRLMARFLSIPIRENPSILTIIKYSISSFITFIYKV